MRLYIIVLVTAFFIPISAGAQYVGVTNTTFDGGQGVFAYNRACHAAHPGSRMCTSEEVMNTVNPPIVGSPGEEAWVRPTYQPGGSVDLYLVDASGQIATGACEGWSVAGGTGLAVRLDDGGFDQISCSFTNRVTCCIPVPEPSASLSIPSGVGVLLALARLRGLAR